MISEGAVVIRRGVLLRATAKKKKDGRAGPISRTVKESYDLGHLIYDRYEEYLSAIASAVEDEAKRAGIDIKGFEAPDRAKMRFRFAPGLIIDFPEFTVYLGELKLLGRACLTVCFNESSSKVWCRFIIDPLLQTMQVAELDTSSDRRLITVASLCERINNVVSDRYLVDFASTIRPKWRAESVRFKKVGELNYIAVQEDANVVADMADKIESQGDQTNIDFAGIREKLDALTRVIEEADDEESPRPRQRQPFRTFSGRVGDPAVFSSLVKGRTATFAVVSGRSEPLAPQEQKRLGRKSNNSALDVTEKLATLMASEF